MRHEPSPVQQVAGVSVVSMSMSRVQVVGGAMALALAGALVVIGAQRNTAAAQQGASAAAAARHRCTRRPGSDHGCRDATGGRRTQPLQRDCGRQGQSGAAGDLERIYVPNLRSNDVYVVDPVAMKVVDRFKVGLGPQHIVPSWDLRTLWVTNNAEAAPMAA